MFEKNEAKIGPPGTKELFTKQEYLSADIYYTTFLATYPSSFFELPLSKRCAQLYNLYCLGFGRKRDDKHQPTRPANFEGQGISREDFAAIYDSLAAQHEDLVDQELEKGRIESDEEDLQTYKLGIYKRPEGPPNNPDIVDRGDTLTDTVPQVVRTPSPVDTSFDFIQPTEIPQADGSVKKAQKVVIPRDAKGKKLKGSDTYTIPMDEDGRPILSEKRKVPLELTKVVKKVKKITGNRIGGDWHKGKLHKHDVLKPFFRNRGTIRVGSKLLDFTAKELGFDEKLWEFLGGKIKDDGKHANMPSLFTKDGAFNLQSKVDAQGHNTDGTFASHKGKKSNDPLSVFLLIR
ncbi:hypothetical protein K402DRAFT_418298 [Aulographum hederae CBS 113979]|uniref:Uncharacterized protein n=1 Tax=Aulographum hederae CBS 113979 TaxID=1176131 RepID=A0A6G1H926_9PEZI|nr:hypothetical protein K402DRAFT_418298 [Aulographum hederae CBS 113979]